MALALRFALSPGPSTPATAPNHHPVANTKWHITVTAHPRRRRLSGTVSYRYLSNGTVVGRGTGGSFRHGCLPRRDHLAGEAIGHPLTFQVVVTTRYGTDYVNLVRTGPRMTTGASRWDG